MGNQGKVELKNHSNTVGAARRTRSPRRRRFNFLIASACMIALSSCASDPGASRYGTKIDQPQVSETTIDTLYGNYLAARHATRERDTSSAAAYYKTALASDPGNQIIRERALLLEITSGNSFDHVGNCFLVLSTGKV